MSQTTQQADLGRQEKIGISLVLAVLVILSLGTARWLTQHTPTDWMWIWTGAMRSSSGDGVFIVVPLGLVAVVAAWCLVLGIIQKFRQTEGEG